MSSSSRSTRETPVAGTARSFARLLERTLTAFLLQRSEVQICYLARAMGQDGLPWVAVTVRLDLGIHFCPALVMCHTSCAILRLRPSTFPNRPSPLLPIDATCTIIPFLSIPTRLSRESRPLLGAAHGTQRDAEVMATPAFPASVCGRSTMATEYSPAYPVSTTIHHRNCVFLGGRDDARERQFESPRALLSQRRLLTWFAFSYTVPKAFRLCPVKHAHICRHLFFPSSCSASAQYVPFNLRLSVIPTTRLVKVRIRKNGTVRSGNEVAAPSRLTRIRKFGHGLQTRSQAADLPSHLDGRQTP
ncbi:hypothetical protein DFH07DRAFT_939800 [Mycena maculata]|uniref:Uncharacterized protein n=1 Tax=Mycena maculata TaxID=230809 RepID=A0AAD7JEZ3_9AGAR|nr:hypothetical protein DFH07DRAFT_939800 [Mycena maculata]